jgi:NADH:ubiquinone oxidoreductase subunit 6 (subunit J)
VSPGWLTRIETLGTTLVVLMVGAMMIWYEAVERERRLALTIGCAVVLYAGTLLALGRRSSPQRIAWWPFAAAGSVTGAVAELINARFLVTVELLLAVVTGVVIGTAHWAALRVWVRLTKPPSAA